MTAEERAKEIIIWLYDLDREHEISHGRYRSALDKIAQALREARREGIEWVCKYLEMVASEFELEENTHMRNVMLFQVEAIRKANEERCDD